MTTHPSSLKRKSPRSTRPRRPPERQPTRSATPAVRTRRSLPIDLCVASRVLHHLASKQTKMRQIIVGILFDAAVNRHVSHCIEIGGNRFEIRHVLFRTHDARGRVTASLIRVLLPEPGPAP